MGVVESRQNVSDRLEVRVPFLSSVDRMSPGDVLMTRGALGAGMGPFVQEKAIGGWEGARCGIWGLLRFPSSVTVSYTKFTSLDETRFDGLP